MAANGPAQAEIAHWFPVFSPILPRFAEPHITAQGHTIAWHSARRMERIRGNCGVGYSRVMVSSRFNNARLTVV